MELSVIAAGSLRSGTFSKAFEDRRRAICERRIWRAFDLYENYKIVERFGNFFIAIISPACVAGQSSKIETFHPFFSGGAASGGIALL